MTQQPKINFVGPDPEELDKMQGAAHVTAVMPYLRSELDRMESSVKTRVFASINDGTLTKEQAEAAWRELHAFNRLLKRLETRIKSGQTVGDRNADYMTIGGPNG